MLQLAKRLAVILRTLAEMERKPGWSPNATIEAARECLRKATRTIARVKRAVKIAGAFGWFTAGMVLWIGGSIAWQEWKPKPRIVKAAPAVVAVPAPQPISREDEMRALYVRDAESILQAYRASDNPSLHAFDWQKAEICLERAVQLGAGDDRTFGELALSKGYATLQRLEGGNYSEEAAAQLRLYARDEFRTASAKMPEGAEPHLALARVYVYVLPNVDEAMAEFAAAEKLGAVLGEREVEQEGDAYRLRAARGDAAKARAYYETVRGFDRVELHLKELSGASRKPAPRRRRWR